MRERQEVEREARNKHRWFVAAGLLLAIPIVGFWLSAALVLKIIFDNENNLLWSLIPTLLCIIMVIGYALYGGAKYWVTYTRIYIDCDSVFSYPQFNPNAKGVMDVKTKMFKQIDEKKMVIDANSWNKERGGGLLLACLAIGFLLIWGAYPYGNGAAGDFLVSIVYTVPFSVGFLALLFAPRQVFIFDREAKTITIPRRSVFHQDNIIPFEKAVITLKVNRKGRLLTYGNELAVLANMDRLDNGVELGFYGRENAYAFARFINEYMTQEKLPDLSGFEEKQEDKEEEYNSDTYYG
ncbi:hypothetical protein [Bacteroides sp.]